jgi:hypothetical protein
MPESCLTCIHSKTRVITEGFEWFCRLTGDEIRIGEWCEKFDGGEWE